MTDMNPIIPPLLKRLKELSAEAERLSEIAPTSSKRLRLLLLKKDIEEFLTLLKREQAKVGAKRSGQLAAFRGTSAYTRTGQLKKTSK